MNITKEEIQNILSSLKINCQAFIDGAFCNSHNNQFFESINPATTEVIASVVCCDEKDVDRAVAAARKSFNSGVWSNNLELRKSVLLTLAKLVEENAKELAVLESIDSGKTITDCYEEISTEVVELLQWYGELIDKSYGRVAPTNLNKTGLIVQEPIGVVGAVVPWNFPLLMAVWKLAPALATGCSVVLKPAAETSLTAIYLAELAQQAGVPDGVLNVVPGLGSVAGQAIGLHNDIDAVSFTGSTEIGAKFLNYASRSNLKSIGLELGGKSPLIILEDAHLTEDLIDNAVSSALWNGGQNCSANMRQIIAQPLVEEYIHLITQKIKSYRIGDPLALNTDIGSMVTQSHMNKVKNYIDIGKKEGATVILDNDFNGDGYFIKPTIFNNVTSSMVIAQEEIFGPVLGVMPSTSAEESLAIAKDTEYGLHASVFTQDIDKAIYFAKKIPCGTISINEFSEGNITTPFGGYKKSGSLSRDNGVEAMQQYLQTKTIWISSKF